MIWEEIVLSDHIDVLTDYHANGAYEKLKANITLKYEKDFAVMIRTLNFERADFEKDLIYLSEIEYEFLSKSKVFHDDILMNKIADPGSVHLMPDLGCPVSLAMNLFLIRFKNSVNQRFMYYLMHFFEPYIKLYTNGAATSTITKDAVRKLKFRVPDINDQKKIATILSAYDDLIENNLKRIKLLEEMAQITYEEWFMRLKFPGHENTPLDSETGLPVGWKKLKLNSLAEFIFGYPFNSSQFNTDNNGMPIIRIRNIPDSSTTDFTTEIVDVKYIVNTGDLLVGMDGEFYINNWSSPPAYLVQRTCNIKPLNPQDMGFIGEAIKAPIKFYESTISGATVAHLGKKHLDEIELIFPTKDADRLLPFFNELLSTKLNLAKQNQLIKEARDILLPRLMTGMIDVEQLVLPELSSNTTLSPEQEPQTA